MTKPEIIQRIRTVCRMRRLSRHTEQTYLHWILRFIPVIRQHPHATREERLRIFLEDLAPRSAASTQNQALNAIIFLYRDVLKEPLGDLGKWARAKRPARLPTWLTHDEMQRLLTHMSGITSLMTRLAYGSGLRLAELLQLRVKDIDLHSRIITVRGGKGDKDRTTCLPRTLVLELQHHLTSNRAVWERDRARNANPIQIPDRLDRKYPNAGREWPWFWLFPANSESTDPRSRIHRRHHIHEDTLGKALKRAARKAGLHKRVTAHTLRHSFATNLLSNGASITQVQELLGHSSVQTTQVYLHCLPQFAETITSPLDQDHGKILPFTQPPAVAATPAPLRHAAQ